VTAADLLSSQEAGLLGLGALGLVAFDQSWQVVRHVIVIAHEGAHAVAASLMFRGVRRITMNPRAEGATVPVRGGGSVGTALITFVGYIGPSAFGLAAAALISAGHVVATLWAILFLLGILLLAVRWSFGLITVLLAGGAVFAVARFAPMTGQVVSGYAITWLLLLSGVRRILEIGLGSQDGKALRTLTGIPHLVWSALWLAASLGAVVLAGDLLIVHA
jgi:hypothetical protein